KTRPSTPPPSRSCCPRSTITRSRWSPSAASDSRPSRRFSTWWRRKSRAALRGSTRKRHDGRHSRKEKTRHLQPLAALLGGPPGRRASDLAQLGLSRLGPRVAPGGGGVSALSLRPVL